MMTGSAAEEREAGRPAPGRRTILPRVGPRAIAGVLGLLVAGLAYAVFSIWHDVHTSGQPSQGLHIYLLLGLALVIALGFEFVNGFHDTANAVATVIYTRSLTPGVAVLWSGLWNFLGVLTSTGAVAYTIVSLLPVELILQVGSRAGFAMVFALLISAIVWNLGTWLLGLPASSSHTLIGSIIGVGIANALVRGRTGTSGVDWSQAATVAKALVVSPLVGFFGAAVLLLAMKLVLRMPVLYRAPAPDETPPAWIRALLILTCTGVSFAHGSNDGQKGMGLIMLILIGTVPTAYALNRALPDSYVPIFQQNSRDAAAILDTKGSPGPALGDTRVLVEGFVRDRTGGDAVYPALAALIRDIADQVKGYSNLADVPPALVPNTRNDMYLVSEALRSLAKAQKAQLGTDEAKTLAAYRQDLDTSVKYIPTWVKVVVALALGLGTTIGWRRIVVTVGEKIGKAHLTYAQGAAAELVAMATIGAADHFGLPVSTTHVLSSGVAGAMAANGSGIQGATVRAILLAWVLTLPAAMALAGVLFVVFNAMS